MKEKGGSKQIVTHVMVCFPSLCKSEELPQLNFELFALEILNEIFLHDYLAAFASMFWHPQDMVMRFIIEWCIFGGCFIEIKGF